MGDVTGHAGTEQSGIFPLLVLWGFLLSQLVSVQLPSSMGSMSTPLMWPKHFTCCLLQDLGLCPRFLWLSHKLSQGLIALMVMTVTLELCFYEAYIQHSSMVKAGENNLYFQPSQKSHTALNVLVSSSVAKKQRKNEWGQLAQFPDQVV